MKTVILGALLICVPQGGFAQAGPFEYVQWTNREGKGFEAKLDRVEIDKVILRARKGGKRYPIKISALSDESKERLLQYRKDVKDEIANAPLNENAPVGYLILKPALIYRAVALGMTETLTEKRAIVPCIIRNVKVSDRLTATLGFEGGLFKQIRAEKGVEFFLKNKTLNSRSSTKRNWSPYYYRYGRVNEGAKVLLQEGEQFKLFLTPESILEWDRVGVSDGPVFR